MESNIAIGVIILAGLVHASFQLGISMVTLLASHSAGKKLPGKRILGMVWAFSGGSVVLTGLLASSITYAVSIIFRGGISTHTWEFTAGALALIGVAVWIFYFQRNDGTSLWLPRSMAHAIFRRIRVTGSAAESFSLGMLSVVAEIIFLIVPIIAIALAITSLPYYWQLPAIILYVATASLSLITVAVLIGSGHRLSRIQEWRQANKRFIQFWAGAGLLVLSAFIYANQVATIASLGGQ